MRIRYFKKLYMSPNIEHPAAVKWRLSHNAGNLALWIITYSGEDKKSEPGGNQLEFFHCMFLHQPWYKKREVLVIGIAEGRAEAIDLVAKITQDCIDSTGGTDLKAFLFPKEQEGSPPVRPRLLRTVDLETAAPDEGAKPDESKRPEEREEKT